MQHRIIPSGLAARVRRAALPALALAAQLSAGICQAQAMPPAPRPTQLEPVVVTGNPLRSGEIAAPSSVLSGDALTLRRGASIGDTLNGQPGLSTTWFGPNASRPVIRGLDGDRVRMLGNSSASIDASSLSFDHALPIDPLIVERLEVLRGPAALMYGGSAIGGVVNAIDNRIPALPIRAVTGSAEARVGGAQAERSAGALLETGNGELALHADAFGRNASDLRVPRFTPVQDGVALPEAATVRNSAARTRGGALGAAWTFPGGHLGAAADTYDSRYGIVAEPDVTVRMHRNQVAVSAELSDPIPALRSAKARLVSARYRHEEIEGDGSVGTTFLSSGSEVRVEAEHVPWGGVRGVLGLQLEDVDFSALGAEAFVPSTRSRRQGVFLIEETAWSAGTLNAGLRLEQARIDSAGDADPLAPQFGPAASRRFSPVSLSVGNVWRFAPAWSFTSTLSSTGRAPTAFELFANGVHAATASFERGDAGLGAERGRNLDLALQWKDTAGALRLGVYQARFSRYIALDATGASVDVPDGNGGVVSFPEYAFRAVRARLEGIEAETSWRFASGSWSGQTGASLDLTRGTNQRSGEPLARIAPLRARLAAEIGHADWTGWALRVEFEHAAAQRRVPSTDTPTAGYNLVHTALTRGWGDAARPGLWFLKLNNIGNTLGFSAASAATIRALSPLPGRSVQTGVRLGF